MTLQWLYDLPTLAANMCIISCPDFWANHYTNICILRFCCISRSNGKTHSWYWVTFYGHRSRKWSIMSHSSLENTQLRSIIFVDITADYWRFKGSDTCAWSQAHHHLHPLQKACCPLLPHHHWKMMMKALGLQSPQVWRTKRVLDGLPWRNPWYLALHLPPHSSHWIKSLLQLGHLPHNIDFITARAQTCGL